MANIYQIPFQLTGSVGTFPNQRFALFGDDLATVTTSGYLNQSMMQPSPLSNNDVIQAFYDYNINTLTGTYGIFTVSVGSNGVITLTEFSTSSGGGVTLPVVDGDFAVFDGTTGTIKDAPYRASNVNKYHVCMATAATTSGVSARFYDANGTIGNGLTYSNGANTYLATCAGGAVVGNFAVYKDANGSISDGHFVPSSTSFTNVAIVDVVDVTPVIGKAALFIDANGSLISPAPLSNSYAFGPFNAKGQVGTITFTALTITAGSSVTATWTNALILSTSTVMHCIAAYPSGNGAVTMSIAYDSVGAALVTIYNNNVGDVTADTMSFSYQIV